MRKYTLVAAVLVGFVVAIQSPIFGHHTSKPEADKAMPKMETLLQSALEGVVGTEVIVSRVTIPPHTSLPKHWHPGEEFIYVIEGSATLWQEGKDDVVAKPGDVLKVPLKQVHTAITADVGTTIVVFRVHEQGKPERVLVEDN